jgi:hypothetical protein
MDTDTLVENLINDGRKLVEELPQRGFDVAAAFWLKPCEDGKWYFYIVSEAVDAEGLAKAYRQLRSCPICARSGAARDHLGSAMRQAGEW